MLETDTTYVVKSMEDVGISDERLVHILQAEEEIRSMAKTRGEILDRIYGFAMEDTKESIMERLMMAYFAGNQSKNSRRIKRFVPHKKELEG